MRLACLYFPPLKMSQTLAVVLLAAILSLPPAFAAPPLATPSAADPAGPRSGNPPQSDAERNEPTDLWQRLRGGLAMPELRSPLVGVHENWFASHPAYLRGAIERSRLYLYHVVEEVEKRGMPMEIALLPIIESAYNPRANSPRQASGIWQFIPSTGKVFGLTQNAWYDGRRDVPSATQAALDYLQALHRQFGNWQLALAAYNCGEGCVARAIQRNRSKGLSTAYQSLSLPNETRHYVPKLMAVRSAIRLPSRFGLDLDALPNQPVFQQVSLSHPMEATTAAKLAEMDLTAFLALNPAFKRRAIYSDSQNTVLLPVDKVEAFRSNIEEAESRHIRLNPYRARKGELLATIAAKFDVTVQWIKDHNPLTLRRGTLAHDQTILLPARGTVARAMTPRAKVAMGEAGKYDNDTSATLPLRYPDVKIPLTPPATPQKAAQRDPESARPVFETGTILRGHLVRRGETLASLAQRYKVSVADIREHNRAARTLRPGDIILIPIAS